MDPFLIKAIQLILSLSLLIVLHELGHFIPAKLFKTKVEKFYLFFDVKFSLFKKKIGETVYGIGWLPLGGYVKIAGMIDESMDKEQMSQPAKPWEFRSKPAWQRLIIMLGGVTVNIILGFVIYSMMMIVWGKTYVSPESLDKGFAVSKTMEELGFQDGDDVLEMNGKPVESVSDINKHLMVRDVSSITVRHPDGTKESINLPEDIGQKLFKAGELRAFNPISSAVIDSVLPEKPAAKAGLKKGDSIIAVNNTNIDHWHEFKSIVNKNPGKEIQLTVISRGNPNNRDDELSASGPQKREIKLTPNENGMIGIMSGQDLKAQTRKYDIGEGIVAGVSFGYWTLHDYVAQFSYVFTKKGAQQVGGFGAIGGLFPDEWDWRGFWGTTALISIILAFMNILPIPALDGGHVAFLLYEIVSGKKPNDKFMEYAQMIGFFLLIALVLYANGNDIYRYFFK